ncbi:hypothetical protein CIB95_01300 [Lottiidibacillus patelloidae]|uniref:Alkyl hydroperoxide reductase subunit C/ Thiol specific antioxidant domain-containing protein n=1 Tax=Lottiidibacillus patelloidae TaxID=2670334 RepID=A0A263BY47_9BACI|nr:hypothetical protein CIB95_01300 [Lottiidibacillus patelloidae]
MQQEYNNFQAKGIDLIIIFPQKRSIVEKFAKKNQFNMTLLVDEDRSVIKSFDVFHLIGIDAFRIARPSVFFINAEGKVAFAYIGKNQKDRLSINELNMQIEKETGKN